VSELSVRASAPGWLGGIYTSSITWPAPPLEAALLDKVVSATVAVTRVKLREVTTSGPYRTKPIVAELSGRAVVLNELFLLHADDVRALPGRDGLTSYVPDDQLWATLWLDSHDRISAEWVVNKGNVVETTFTYPR
jgi:hypothetical protein